MREANMLRLGALSAMLGGLAFVVDGLLVLADSEAQWTNLVYVVAALLVVVGILGLNVVQSEYLGRLGQIGLYVAVVTLLGQVLGILVFLVGSPSLEWLVFPVGFLAVPIGLVLYGIATLRAWVLPSWCGIGLIVVPLLAVVFGDAGEILFGVLWLALGYVLWSGGETSVGEPHVR